MRDVIEIQLTRVKAHLVLEHDLSLIDCGYAGSVDRIAGSIAGHGRSLGELRRLVITHGHPDHAGSARALADLGVPIMIHPDDWTGLQRRWRDLARRPSRGGVFAAMTPTPTTFQPIHDGDVLPMLGGLRVIHTPGHTPGSVCLYGERDRILFVGDMLQRRFGRLSFASGLYSDDVANARRAVKRLARLDVETLVFSHYAALEVGAAQEIARLASRVP